MVSYRKYVHYLEEEPEEVTETQHLTGLLIKDRPKSLGILVHVHPSKIKLSKGNLYNYLKVDSLPAFVNIPKQQCLWINTGIIKKGKRVIEVDYFFSSWFRKIEYHLAGPEEQFIDFEKYNSERVTLLKKEIFGIKIVDPKPVQQTLVESDSVQIKSAQATKCYFCIRELKDLKKLGLILNEQGICSECVKELAEYTQL